MNNEFFKSIATSYLAGVLGAANVNFFLTNTRTLEVQVPEALIAGDAQMDIHSTAEITIKFVVEV